MEDGASVDAHIEKMKAEIRKANPDNNIITDRMSRTAAHREGLVKVTGVCEVLSTYPALRYEREVQDRTCILSLLQTCSSMVCLSAVLHRHNENRF